MSDANTDRPALSPPAEGEPMSVAAGRDYWAGKTDAHAVASAVSEQASRQTTPTPAPAEVPFAAEDACLACNSPTPALVDWSVVGPKLVRLIERVDAERKRETVRLNHLKRAVAAVAAEARAALAATPQSNGE